VGEQASGGVGTPAHMGAELILKSTGVQALHVPYKGASESANAVLGKQVDFALTISSVSLPHIAAGKLKALAITAPTRNPRLPDVPTLAEAGIPGVTDREDDEGRRHHGAVAGDVRQRRSKGSPELRVQSSHSQFLWERRSTIPFIVPAVKHQRGIRDRTRRRASE
jgi:hypothetical protein